MVEAPRLTFPVSIPDEEKKLSFLSLHFFLVPRKSKTT